MNKQIIFKGTRGEVGRTTDDGELYVLGDSDALQVLVRQMAVEIEKLQTLIPNGVLIEEAFNALRESLTRSHETEQLKQELEKCQARKN